MDIALIIGVIFGFVCMIGSIAYALFVEGSAGGFGNFLSAPSFGIVFGGMIASIFVAFPMPHVVALERQHEALGRPQIWTQSYLQIQFQNLVQIESYQIPLLSPQQKEHKQYYLSYKQNQI